MLLSRPQSVVLKCCLLFLSPGRLGCTEKLRASDEPLSGPSKSAAGCGFHVNESMINIK